MDAFKEIRVVLTKLSSLRRELPELRKAVTRLDAAQQEWRVLCESLIKKLEYLDVASRANMGWEHRIVQFLMDLVCLETVELDRENIVEAIAFRLQNTPSANHQEELRALLEKIKAE